MLDNNLILFPKGTSAISAVNVAVVSEVLDIGVDQKISPAVVNVVVDEALIGGEDTTIDAMLQHSDSPSSGFETLVTQESSAEEIDSEFGIVAGAQLLSLGLPNKLKRYIRVTLTPRETGITAGSINAAINTSFNSAI